MVVDFSASCSSFAKSIVVMFCVVSGSDILEMQDLLLSWISNAQRIDVDFQARSARCDKREGGLGLISCCLSRESAAANHTEFMLCYREGD